MSRWLASAGTALFLAVLLNPFFFSIYRLMIFNTVPRDDYAPFLLRLLGKPEGAFPDSPYGYRILSMMAAAPFYYLLPVVRLTNMPDTLGLSYVKATAAIAGLSYACLIGGSVLIYRLPRDRCGTERSDPAKSHSY